MLKILIVEDEPLLAKTLKHLIELNPRYEVIEIADDLVSALAAAEERLPDLALVDLQLARGSTGFSVAVKLNEIGVPSLFTTGKAPSFPMPDLALGCLMKPYTEEDIVRALKTAEDILRGRERLRPSRPQNLTIYSDAPVAEPLLAEVGSEFLPEPAMAERRSLKSVLTGWWSATS
jgi:DNA-binding NarL/FixJ family response regulator